MSFLKKSRAAVAAALLSLLAACGGGSSGTGAQPVTGPTPTPTPGTTPSFSIGGSIYALGNTSGLTLIAGSETLAVAANATSFTFVTKVVQGTAYSVTIGKQPAGLACTVANGSGTVGQDNITQIQVACSAAQDNGRYTVSTVAGDDGQSLVDGVGKSARFASPYAIAKDGVGNFYVSDTLSRAIRKVSPAGVVSTVAVIDGNPQGLALDAADNLYVADNQNTVVLKITPSGVVSTYAGSAGKLDYVDGAAGVARFGAPLGVAVDPAGNVYVSEAGTLFTGIRKIAPSGVVSTLAGGPISGFVDGDGASARFGRAGQLALDRAGNLFVADSFYGAIRKVTPAGTVTTVVGGPATGVPFGAIEGIALDSAANIYVADASNCSIRKVTPTAVVSTLAGASSCGMGGTNSWVDGTGAAARFSSPTGIVIDADGNLQVADQANRSVRTVTPTGVVTTLAGQGPFSGPIDGTGTAARFNSMSDIAVDGADNVYVSDGASKSIRKMSPAGVVTTVSNGGYYDIGSSIATDASGNVYFLDTGGVYKMSPNGVTSLLQVSNVRRFAVDAAGKLYFISEHAVFTMGSNGVVTPLAGSDSSGFADGAGAAARFNYPSDIAVDGSGNVYVADTSNNAIRKVSPQGQVTTVSGGGFSNPSALTVDANGNIFAITDLNSGADSHGLHPAFGGAVVKISKDGVTTRVAGSYVDLASHIDGDGSTARFAIPKAIVVDSKGNLYVADSRSLAIRKISR